MENISINDQDLKEKLEKNKKSIANLLNKREENIEKEAKTFMKYIEKYKTIIDFLRGSNVYFTHPKYKYISSRGPVLYYNSQKEFLYIYDVETNKVVKINMYNKKEENMWLQSFFDECDGFEDAIEGIIHTVKIQEIAIKELEGITRGQDDLLNKYKLD